MPGGRSYAERLSAPTLTAALRSLPLARAAQVALGSTILFVVFGSSSVPELERIGSPLRWVCLAAFSGLAVAWAVAEGVRVRDLVRAGTPALFLAALGAASAAWSVTPLHSLARAVAFGVVALAASAAATAASRTGDRAESLAAAIVAVSVLVCVVGVPVYLIDPALGAQQASVGTSFRFSGLGQSPNTVSMLAAIAGVLAIWLAFVARERWRRLLYVCAFCVFWGEIVVSGSRGGMFSLAIGAVAFAVAIPAGVRRRILVLAGALVVSASVVAGNRLLQNATALPVPKAAQPSGAASAAPQSTAGQLPRMVLPPLHDELGAQVVGVRALFGSDGRATALQEAFDQGSQRPVLGWGIGTETRVFFERSAEFRSRSVENSYLTLFLELGAVGVGLWLLAAPLVALAALRARRLDVRTRFAVAGAGATVAAGFALAVAQSYVTSAGNVATLSYWLAVGVAIALAGGAEVSGRRPRVVALAAGALLVAAVPVGLWESGHARAVQNAGIREIWRNVGGRLQTPELDGFRRMPPVGCFLYRAGGSIGGYELCFDDGGLTEAYDRRNGGFRVWTVRPFGPQAASIHVSPAAVDRQLRRLGAYKPGLPYGFGYLARNVPPG